MNIFEDYLKKFKTLVLSNLDKLNLDPKTTLDGIVIELPPPEFNFDLSTNIALVLAKKSNQQPAKLASSIIEILKNNLNDFSDFNIAGPGFINLKFSDEYYQKIIEAILDIKENYGSNKKKEKYNVEFVSANPTGPMHIGHSRGAILVDTLSNLLPCTPGVKDSNFFLQ